VVARTSLPPDEAVRSLRQAVAATDPALNLFNVGPRDRVTYVLGLSLMAMVALLACWYPAQRAMRVDPSAALREE
jgi:hypothetical protein